MTSMALLCFGAIMWIFVLCMLPSVDNIQQVSFPSYSYNVLYSQVLIFSENSFFIPFHPKALFVLFCIFVCFCFQNHTEWNWKVSSEVSCFYQMLHF